MAEILLIGDEENIRSTVVNIIREEGHQVSSAENVAKAVHLLKENKYDVIVSDIILPDNFGIELLKELREASTDIPVIMMIGEPMIESVADSLREGAFDYLPKPVSRGELSRLLARVVKMKHLEEENKLQHGDLENLIKEHRVELFSLKEQLNNEIAERKGSEARLKERGKLLRMIAENYPNSYLSIIEKDLTIGYTSGQEFKKQSLNPDVFVGLSLEEIFGDHTHLVTESYLKTFDGEEQKFELFINNQHQLYKTVPLPGDSGKIDRILVVTENISERKKAENELKLSEEKFRVLYKNSPDMYFSVSPDDARMIMCNDTFLKNIGYSEEEVIGASIFNMYHDDCMEEVKEVFDQFKKTGEVKNRELILKRKDGSKIDVSLNSHCVKDKTGKILYSMSSWRDITEKKKTEKDLLESEKRYRKAQAMGKVGNWEYNLETTDFWASEEAKRIYGFNAEAPFFTTEDVENCIPERARVHQALIDLIEKGEEYNIEFEIKTKDTGEIKSIHSMAEMEKNTDGRPIKVSGVVIDISSRMQAEGALKESEGRYRLLAENTVDVIWLMDLNMVFTYVNPAIHGLTGYTVDEWLGSGLKDHCDEENFKMIAGIMGRSLETLPETAISTFEVALLKKNGEHIYVEISGKVILSEENEPVALQGVTRDITPRKVAEEKELSMLAQLQQVQKLESIGVLAAGVAHEINNPLMGMINYADIIQEKVEDIQLKEFAGCIMDEGNRIGAIVQNLLSFSSQDKQNHSPASISDIINKSLSLTAAVLRKHQIIFLQDIPEDLPPIKCRSQQIQQVILNLLTNATFAVNEKYDGYHDDKIIKIIVKPIIKENVSYLRITVEDHGIGIGDDIIDHIFDPFFSTKGRAHGTGLGLSISYGIVNEHRGVLSVETKIGEYTRFHMDLPVDGGEVYEGSDVKNRFPNETKAEE